MSIEQASAFLNDWVAENVHSVAHPRNNRDAQFLARRCLEAAEKQGISKTELEQCCKQDLVKCMHDAQVAAAEAITGLEEDSDEARSD